MSFYVPLGDGRFEATEHTVGPWSPTDQHAGPPSALLVRALEQVLPADGALARVSVDLLGAVPVGELAVTASVVRPGRSVQLAVATLAAGGRDVARATAWWHRSGDTAAVAVGAAPAPPLPIDEAPPANWPGGYMRAMEWRVVKGDFNELGPAVFWSRMRMPLVAGEEPTPAQRTLVTADSGNGVSSAVPLEGWLFVNTELTVHLLRPPVGNWICLDAVSTIGPTGGGYATSTLSDRTGEIARAAQALLVRRR